MDRREFFKRGLKSLTETAVEVVDNKISRRVHWIRPPYAVAEMEFLLYCSRCGDCTDACPHQLIFPLANTLTWDQDRPHINPDTCTGCGLCREACIATPKAIDIQLLGNQLRT